MQKYIAMRFFVCPKEFAEPRPRNAPPGHFCPAGRKARGTGCSNPPLLLAHKIHAKQKEQHPIRCCSFCYALILWGSKRGGFEQPVPRALCPAGQKRPGGAFLGRGLANSFGSTKKRIAMCFCNAFFVLMLFRFRIILVAYHLRHQCTALLPVDHFSTDLWCFA